jgi:hypothetical protein
MSSRALEVQENIRRLAEEFHDEQFRIRHSWLSPVPCFGKVLNGKDLRSLVHAALNG